MSASNICLLGGCGFVGRALAGRLAAEGRRVRVVTRRRTNAQPLLVLPTIDVVVADPHDDATLARAFAGCDAVVNLVAILHARRGSGFDRVNVEFARRVALACRAASVPRLVHVSALGAATNAPSEYLRSRARGEEAVRDAAGTAALTIFRPSVIYGEDDSFLNLLGTLTRLFPVIPLAGADARFQPVWVEDVARAIAVALDDPRTHGRTYSLCGPRAYRLRELATIVASLQGRSPWIVPLPGAIARLQALVMEWLPGPLMTRDNLRSMQVDNVCEGPFPEIFGFQPAALETVLPEYPGRHGRTARYSAFRLRAGR